jgi:trehalose 6-phosphate synthase
MSTSFRGDEIHWRRPASGLVTAVEPIMRATGGTWVAHGSGSADRKVVDPDGRIMVPPNAPRYALRRVWLTEEEEKGYYYGFANETLWPLCHVVYVRPTFRSRDWAHYQAANAHFCRAVAEEAPPKATVWVHDYHLALLPAMLKAARPDLTVAHFWHIRGRRRRSSASARGGRESWKGSSPTTCWASTSAITATTSWTR